MNRPLVVVALAALFAAGCGGSSVGRPCTTDSDCDTGQTCYTDVPGGYCSRGCSAEGSTTDCPGGTVCALHSTRLLCSAVCQQQSDCRTEYECNGLSGAEVKACRPKAK